MWQTGSINPAQEHFITHLVRQKFMVAIDALGSTDKKHRGTAILFLPENELHEISLLFYNYLLKARNYKTVYLGQTVPVANLAELPK
jgi:methanogenic corrinoid protein MtbC1